MNYKHFSIEEREKIQEKLWQKASIRSIAAELGRDPSSVSREVNRNFPPERKVYTPRLAHERALEKRSCRGRKDRLKNETIRTYVITHLKKRWSPEQISGTLKTEKKECISPEAIYQYIYAQIKNGKVKNGSEDLRSYLRRKRKRRVPKGARRCQRVLKPRGISIDERPKSVDKRIRTGHWEGDSVESCDHKPGLNTVVERKIGMLFMTKVKDKTSQATVDAMEKRFVEVPQRLKHTVTLDNGPENSEYELIEEKTGLKCFFAHPYHSWERGTNENTNGLIRDYFPKGTDFSMIPDEEITRVELEINSRPRKRLGWRSPLQVWSVALQS